ncbi:hypothetical protein ACFL3V_02470 [Nanoarchaeota archaeon]
MVLKGHKKEMLFILGQFLKATDKKFGPRHLSVSVSKVEFIESIIKLDIVAKKDRAVYRNLEELQKSRMVIYDEKSLRISKKGFAEYDRILKEFGAFIHIMQKMDPKKITFKRKTQTRLR